jgi:hypothetical protein
VMVEPNSCGRRDIDKSWIVSARRCGILRKGRHGSHDAQTDERENEENRAKPPKTAVPSRESSVCFLRSTHAAGPSAFESASGRIVRLLSQHRRISSPATGRAETRHHLPRRKQQNSSARETRKRFPELTANSERIRLGCRHEPRKPCG